MSIVKYKKINNVEINYSDAELKNVLKNEKQNNQLDEWIDEEVIPFMTRKYLNRKHTSYKLRHVAEDELGFYVSNMDIKIKLAERGSYS